MEPYPANPANQQYSWEGSAIVVSWDAVAGVDHYNIYYDDFSDSGCSLSSSGRLSFCEELATNVAGTSFTHSDTDSDNNYYWVTACNSAGCSEIDSDNPARLVGPTPIPDLVVGTPAVNNSSPDVSARFALSATVRNQGHRRSLHTTLHYYRSTDSTITSSDTEEGTDFVSSLDPSEGSDESFRLAAPSTAGTYYYGACVEEVSDETATGNNCSDAVRVNVGLAPVPDLVVGTPTVSDESPVAGTEFTLSVTVHNQGGGESFLTTLHHYRSLDSTITTSDTLVGMDLVRSLEPDDSSDESINLTAPSDPGTYYYGACVEEVSDETDASNNCSSAVTVAIGTGSCVGAVADPNNEGLVSDCEALLAARDVLASPNADGEPGLNWSPDTTLAEWEGVTLRGTPARVAWLNIRGGDLGGSLPAELSRLSNLSYLNLRNNGLSGPIPTELGNLTNLRYLGLNNNELTGPIPDLSGMTHLEQLYLSNNDLSGKMPDWMGTLTKLRELWLWGNELEGTIPDLSDLTALDRVKLQDNNLEGGIPTWFGEMTNLRYLYLHRNPLGGEIPPELGGMTKLRYVWLHTSELTGEIPKELGNLENLWDLNLHSNDLGGTIPNELGDLSSLTHLRLHRNELSGAVPGELGDLSRLKFMWLHGNQLTGEIPLELGSLASLQRLYLSENKLSGIIPAELDNLADTLTHWRLGGNQFTGCVPAGLARVHDNDLDSLGLDICGDS